ncbi:NADPH-dependent aldehyde reductase [Rhizoctonia solani 123E]|uniref:NADPH-dependent aldehyde reductase n=1 Tax=Rhizoctonia solani 123E TaxID=1423351 RepID=A0A074RPK1_9AGAM|nr:NADPH-dependent aldehyde reductase [Rhizoctonia solani 123E]
MPAIKTDDTVLVTGASGFIAVWVCQYLLEAGYKVKGTVRSASKGDYLVNLFKPYGDKFKYVIVEDMSKNGAFDEVVKGVDAIAHTASPVNFDTEDPKDVIEPAVRGTTEILESVHKYAPAVKRVVITSSVVAITDVMFHLKIPGTIYTESDWNTRSIQEIQEKGKDALGIHKYCASKVMAEKAAWDFVAKTNPNWDLVTCCPSLVYGPILHQVSDPSTVNTSIAMVYNFVHNKESMTEETLLTPNNFVDVRDVALAHVRALEVEEAGGQRFITASAFYCWQDTRTWVLLSDNVHLTYQVLVDVLNLPPGFPRGTPGAGKALKHIVFSHAKAKKILGMEFKGLQECMRDTVEGLQKRGWGVMV